MDRCNKCQKEKEDQCFIDKFGKKRRMCDVCRDREQAYRKKNLCQHGKSRRRCKDCGTGYCEHGNRKDRCKDCGKGFCEHGRYKGHCTICGHGNCEHGRYRHQCKDCGKGYCEHGKRKDGCRECGGVAFCPHGNLRYNCRNCLGIKGAIRTMLVASKAKDKKTGRYDPENFVDVAFMEKLFEANPDLICPYCNETMNLDDLNPKLVTIERIDNAIGHIKSNCTLACLKCNKVRVGQRK